MRIALVDGSPKSVLYPLPLLKLGAWQKDAGNHCELFIDGRLPEPGAFDEIWVTTRFTFDVLFARSLILEAVQRASRVWVGGISVTLLPNYFKNLGADIHLGLLPAAESYAPDYSLLEGVPEYSITHTSRGCIRKCKFCMVTKLEPEFSHRSDWERDLSPETTRVLFYDNNWFAKDPEDFKSDVEKIKRLVSDEKITWFDFNQGLDARLLTDEIADMLEGLPMDPVRFAFDGLHEDGHYQRAIERMTARGFRNFLGYVLYNFMDTPQDFYYRLREAVRLQTELRPQLSGPRHLQVQSFPMKYQPILDVNSRNYTGKHWTPQKLKGFNAIRSYFSAGWGTITAQGGATMEPIEEFEYWLGGDAQEFERLISYPKIRELMKRKKGVLRMDRAKAKTAPESVSSS